MKKSVVLFSFWLILSSCLHAQQTDVNVIYVTAEASDTMDIYYHPGVKLIWSDFQGTPRETERIAAETSSGIGYKYKFKRLEDQVSFDFEVYAPFRKDRSWVKNDEKKTPYTLNHEQRHFDISFINTLLFMQTLRNSKFPAKGFKKLIDDKYNAASVALSNMQHEYDAQTRNGLDENRQAEWNRKIDLQIAVLTKAVLEK